MEYREPDACYPFAEFDDRPPLALDWYEPSQASAPLVIWIHGGGWRKGDRKVYPPALTLLEHGFAVASIDYRLTDRAKFPAQIEDCRAAVRFIRRNSERLSIDPHRIGVWGSSAGGHLAALLGASADMVEWDGVGGHQDCPAAVQAVCDWFGPTDLLRMNDLPGKIDHDAPDSPESLLIGCPIQASPDLTGRANPITYLASNATPPYLIVHGTEDRVVIPEQSLLLHEALLREGRESQFIPIDGAGHGFDVERDPWILDQCVRFFCRTLN